jgi:outer membrane protein assembly factor BamA
MDNDMPKLFYFFLFSFLTTQILHANTDPIIRSIVIEGNRYATTDAIKSRLPYRERAYFDPYKSSDAIDALYQMGHFKQVCIEKENVGDNEIDLFITVEEKKRLEKIKCSGTHTLSKKKIIEKLKLENCEMIDEEDLEFLKRELLAAYREEGHYFANVTVSLIPNKETVNKVTSYALILKAINSLTLTNYAPLLILASDGF